MRIRIPLVTLIRIRIPLLTDPDLSFQIKARSIEVPKKAHIPYNFALSSAKQILVDVDPNPDPAYHCDADPDPAYHFDAGLDPTFLP
jgi:hypothetical protein